MAYVDPGRERGSAITLGVPYEHSRWFRGRETTMRSYSACPDGDCCQRPPAALAARWEGQGVALGAGALAHPVRAADRELPRRGRG